MIKKLLVAAAALLFVSCQSDGGFTAEDVIRPEVTDLTISPESPTDREVVTVRAKITCEKGVDVAYIDFWLEGEGLETAKRVGYAEFEGSPTEVEYEGLIPGQRAGSIVNFVFRAIPKRGSTTASRFVEKQYVVGNAPAAVSEK